MDLLTGVRNSVMTEISWLFPHYSEYVVDFPK